MLLNCCEEVVFLSICSVMVLLYGISGIVLLGQFALLQETVLCLCVSLYPSNQLHLNAYKRLGVMYVHTHLTARLCAAALLLQTAVLVEESTSAVMSSSKDSQHHLSLSS